MLISHSKQREELVTVLEMFICSQPDIDKLQVSIASLSSFVPSFPTKSGDTNRFFSSFFT